MQGPRRHLVTWTARYGDAETDAPAAWLLGIRKDGARLAMVPAEYHYNPIGTVHGGVIATLLDMAMTAAVRAVLPPGRGCTRLEIKVNYLRGVTEVAGKVWAEASVVQAGRRVAMTEARLVDQGGRVYASASSTHLVAEAQPPHAAPAGEQQRAVAWSDPRGLAQAASSMAGLDFLRAMGSGSLPPPPVMVLTGIELGAAEPGEVAMRLPPGEHLHDAAGGVHGGMVAVLLDSVMGCAVHSTLPAGHGYTTIEIKVNFIRAITAATGLITGTGRLVHAGRQVASAEAWARDAAGTLHATASTTCLVFEARP